MSTHTHTHGVLPVVLSRLLATTPTTRSSGAGGRRDAQLHLRGQQRVARQERDHAQRGQITQRGEHVQTTPVVIVEHEDRCIEREMPGALQMHYPNRIWCSLYVLYDDEDTSIIARKSPNSLGQC